MPRQLVILAGGKGTRLKERLGDLPKPMIPIAGKPLLEHQVELAKKFGFTDLIFFVHYRADLIEKHFGDGKNFGVRIEYVLEKEPLGTAGAVLAGFEKLAERFVVLYGDTMVNVDLQRIWNAHENCGTGVPPVSTLTGKMSVPLKPADATLLLHPNDHPFDSDLVEINSESLVTAFHNRPHAENVWRQNLVNAGLYVLEKSALKSFHHMQYEMCKSPWVLDFGKDIFPRMIRFNRKKFPRTGRNLLGYNSPEFIKDIGTPERYDKICAQFENGIVQKSSLATPQRAIFLDRDGTLNADTDCLRRADELELLPGVAEAVHELNQAGWRTVVVTNQPVIAKGFCDEVELQRIHNKLESLLGRGHAFLDRIYFCPHHPEKGFAGERADLKIDCDCRKPKTGMIKKAVADLNIDLKQSWFIGDTTTDVQTAKNAGLKSILVRTGAGGRDGKFSATPDFVFDTLAEAVDFIVRKKSEA